ncbi:MAG: hypothetical protein HC897_04605 [Thermoanaerobaculia bacterium]|nr:hypothetical protein [Thermoanaerobaculia bacterium]
MRKLDLQPRQTNVWKRWIRDCERETRALCEATEQGSDWPLKDLYKRKSIRKTYFFNQEAPFYGKCAYCEAPVADYQHGDVDHFRPKAGVTDEHDRPVPHPGYYWLAYDWRNLLPTCTRCNQPAENGGQKIGKHMRFPVEGSHALRPAEVASEKPLLIHPGSDRPEDDPARHLRVNAMTGLMAHTSERGRLCIEIFGLNLRGQLVEDRKRAATEARSLLTRIVFQPGGDDEAVEKLREIKAGKRPFTMAQLAVLEEVEARLRPAFEA